MKTFIFYSLYNKNIHNNIINKINFFFLFSKKRFCSTNETGKNFKLNPQFVEKFKDIVPPFGFNGLGELVYKRSYSRMKLDGSNEEW